MRLLKKLINKIIRQTIGGYLQIGKFRLKIFRGQNLPFVLAQYPDYGQNLARLAKIIETKYQPLKIFDIGGNIGDTIAMLLSSNSDYKILSVEGDDKYLKILKQNFNDNKSVHIYNNFLGDKNKTINHSISRTGGTLKIDPRESKDKIGLITLDTLLEKNSEGKEVKLLKIDTDGYDNNILRGAKSYLEETKPVIYFEYDNKFLKDNGEEGLDIFPYLQGLGYQILVFFDNYGRFLISTETNKKETLSQLDHYINDREGAFAYYDIVAFHLNDADIAQSFIKNEESKK
ncbi:MAG: FkbM family methyltransferase [Candidatus Paceibacterota bacterium]|jgi:FkbM family methyltransferase